MSRMLTPLLVLVVAVLAVALFLRGGQVLYAISSWNTSQTTVSLGNSLPVVEFVNCSDDGSGYTDPMVQLLGGTTKIVTCNATVTDPNGGSEINISTPKGVFFDNATKGISTCNYLIGAANIDCYRNNSCTWLGRINESSQYVECKFSVWYNAKNTTSASDIWFGHINITDIMGGVGGNNDSIEMEGLLAIGVSGVLSFGTKVAGVNDSTVGTGCGGCNDDIYNYGNVPFKIQTNGSDMSGTSCSIPRSNLHVNLTDNGLYSQSYALTAVTSDSVSALGAFRVWPNLTASVSDPTSPPSNTTYWGLGVPVGQSGTCQSTVWFLAISV